MAGKDKLNVRHPYTQNSVSLEGKDLRNVTNKDVNRGQYLTEKLKRLSPQQIRSLAKLVYKFGDLYPEKIGEPVYILFQHIKEMGKNEVPPDSYLLYGPPVTIVGFPLRKIHTQMFSRIPTNIYVSRSESAWKNMLQIQDVKNILGKVVEICGLNAELRISEFGSIYYFTSFTRKRSKIKARILKDVKIEVTADSIEAEAILDEIRDKALREKWHKEQVQRFEDAIDWWRINRPFREALRNNVFGAEVRYVSHKNFYDSKMNRLPMYVGVVYLGSLMISSQKIKHKNLYCYLVERISGDDFKLVCHPERVGEPRVIVSPSLQAILKDELSRKLLMFAMDLASGKPCDPIVVICQVSENLYRELLNQGLTKYCVIELDKFKWKTKFSGMTGKPYFKLTHLKDFQDMEVKIILCL